METVLSSVKYTPDGVPYHGLNDFQDLQWLDSGGYGIVFKGYSTVEKDGVRREQTVAVKEFFRPDEYSEREILILKKHSHPNVVELFGVIWDGKAIRDQEGNEKLQYSGYVMEYMELGSLHKEIHDVSKTYNIGLAILWIRQIGSGLQFLHENHIIHRDVKPEKNVGTQYYRAPEVLTSNNYDERADVFSFGVTIWEIFHRKRPWEYLKKDSEGNVGTEPIIDSAAMEGELCSLVKRCWQEPSTRPSIEEITAFEPTFDPTIVIEKEGPIDETVVVNRSTSTWDTFTVYLRRVLSSVKYTPDGVPYHGLNDFKDLQRLDSGGYGIVYKGSDVTRFTREKRTVAVKVFNHLDVYAEREIEILKTASHRHIVELFGVIWDGATKDIDGTLMLLYSGYVMEYLELGSLHKEIHDISKQYNMELIVPWIQQIGSGLQYLHENGILHRDVKPKNILLATRTHLKLADFGLARNISHKNTYTSGLRETDPYMAPEIVDTEKNYGAPADVYSFGVTIWEIICRKSELPIDPDKMNEDSWNFVKRCWQRNISDRPSIKEIIAFAAKFVQTILVMGGDRDNTKMTIWNRGTSTWTVSRMELLDHIQYAGVVYLDDEFYLITHGKAFFKLDKNMEWKQLADMNEEPGGIKNSCLEWNGYIWVFGGWNEKDEYLKSVERYDPKEDKWTRMPDMKYARCEAAAAVCNRKIYICGGRGDGYVILKSVECFDPESGVWTELTDMPTPRVDHSLVCYRNNCVVVIGGRDGREGTTVLELDPFEKNGQWKELSPLLSPISISVGVVLGREIFAIGQYSDKVQIFDGINWRVGPSFPSNFRRYAFAVLVPQEFADRLSSYPIDLKQ